MELLKVCFCYCCCCHLLIIDDNVAGDDYESVSTIVTIEVGITTAAFQVRTLDDNINELTETFTVILSDPSGALLGPSSTATVSIDDADSKY